MNFNTKRLLSGLLAVVTIATSAIQPLPVFAAEKDKEKPPSYELVKELLDADEVVKARDLELEMGTSFDIKTDFTNIDIPDSKKVKVTFEEALNEQQESFDNDHEDTYTAVYYVEPMTTDHPTYQICRKIIVKDVEAKKDLQTNSSQTESQGDSGGEKENVEDDETDSEGDFAIKVESTPAVLPEVMPEALSEEEFDKAIEKSEAQYTVDEETGLSLSDVMLQGEEQGIDFAGMKEGETVIFDAVADGAVLFSAKATQKVSVARGSWYYYSDYGLGTYMTAPYTVKYGNISATAYCIQPSKVGPGDGTYTVTRLGDNKALAKVCYYGTKASGDKGFFAEKYPDFSAGKKFIITHLAVSYANGSSDAFSGTNATGKALAMELYNYCIKQPEIPDVAMSFSNAKVKAYVDGNGQRTPEVTFKADALQTITFKLPSGVKFHNVTTGKTSKAGASVEINGGTKFYLSAPITQAEDVNAIFSATMKGSITKDFAAYKITTGGSTQDLAFVFGEGVDDEKYVDFSVEWLKMATIEIVKRDDTSGKNLAGAVYGVYSDSACTKLIKQMPATDSKGASSLTIEKTQDVVYLKEITPPKGYVLSASSVNVSLQVGKTTSKIVTDKEQKAELTIYKEGEMLTGATVTETGVKFLYGKKRLKGATYNVYAAEDIFAADGTSIFNKGDLVKENLITDESGSVTLGNLHLGVYSIKETGAPENYVNHGEIKTVTISSSDQTVEVVFSSATFMNDRQKVKVSVSKLDSDTRNPLDGGKYGLYAYEDISDVDGKVIVEKDSLIEVVTTGEDGVTVFTADLPINYSYYVKEVQAPENYFRNNEDVYLFRFTYTNQSEATVSFSHTFVNERVDAQIQLYKVDKEAGKAQGDAKLEGAVYGLYAREDIIHPDGSTGILYKAGTQITTMTTDDNGKAFVENLYLGHYYIKEITPSVGYLLDEEEHDLNLAFEGDTVKTVKKEATSKEQVIKQPFQIIKAANNGETDAELLRGAGFSAYLESSLRKKADGTYDFASATPVVIGENGATEMFTDEKGYACSIPLPFGTYVVRETTTPHNYKPVDDFIVRITENHPDEPQVWRVLLDKEFEAKLKIVKQDDETKKPVLQKGTEFKIFDLKHKKYVEQITTYPTTVIHKSYFTDEKGYLILPQNLKIGEYRIEEVQAPSGYILNENYYKVTVDSNTAYQMDGTSGDVIIEIAYENHPVKGELTIVKEGEVLEGYKDDFTYQTENLKGAEFQIYAAEDIYTADFQRDENGNRILEYAAGTLVKTVTTDEDGKAYLENLPLGSYKIVETAAPEGFVLNSEAQTVTFAYKDQKTPVIKQTATVKNDRQKVDISVVKKDAEDEAAVAGAEFGIYAKNDIEVQGKVIVKADTLLGKAVSNTEGKAVFNQDFPFGEYYIKELMAPKGYISSDEVLEVKAEYKGQDVPVVQISSEIKNTPTKVVVSKSDLTTGVELSGATLTVLDKDGNVVDTWKSVKDEVHLIERLAVGETYTLREEMAPYGYLKAEEITFTIEDTGEIQKIEMKDDVPKGTILINKNGEFLEKVTPLDSIGGWVSHLFQYLAGKLQGVTFEVYALDDVKAADGESKDYYKKDELVATITTDASGIAKVSDLPLGKYYVKEKATVDGFVLDEEAREIDLTYRDQDTAEVTYSSDWQNNRQKVEVEVLKKAKNSDHMLEGAVFALCAKEDITGINGKVILKADTVIEELATDKDGRLKFMADLPIGFSYYIKETCPAPGFVTTNEIREFTFNYEGPEKEKVFYSFTFENEPTKVKISKTDISGNELPGAKLTILDKDGKVVENWTSSKEPHYIEMLPIGEYTLHEETAPEGYLVAEDVKFEVKDTNEIQKVVMKDEAKPEETPDETPEETPTPEKHQKQEKNPPKTGDNTPILPLFLLVVISLTGIVSAAWMTRKKK